MKFKTTKFKIKTTFEQTDKNTVDLTNKKNNSQILPTRNKVNQVPRTIYDSGWIEALSWDGITVPDNADPNARVLVQSGGSSGTTRIDDPYPSQITYRFNQFMDIPEQFLPYVETDILVKSYPTATFLQGEVFNYYSWKDKYTQLKGDSTLLYKGYDPPNNEADEYTTEEINSGITTPSLTSKYFEGEVEYTIGGDNYRIVGKVDRMTAYYNVVYVPEVDDYNYDYFYNCFGFTDLNGSTFRGRGTHLNITWVESPPGNWTQVGTTTKNVLQTVPVDEDTTYMRWFGTKYKNGVQQSGGIHTIVTSGTFGGNATLTSLDVDYLQNNRIFYSDKWARQLLVNTSTRVYINTPSTNDYETAILPYTNLTYEVNPNDFPEDEIGSPPIYTFFEQVIRWIRLDENSDTYRLSFQGNLYYSSPANQASTQDVDIQDETYSQSGSSYSRDSINRGTKEKDIYFSELFPIELKLVVRLINPLRYHDNQKFKIE